MNDEIPALAVIEGYRRSVVELTEENIILKWQIQQEKEHVQNLVEAMGQVGDLQAEDYVDSAIEINHG
jgi:hypothetical protein